MGAFRPLPICAHASEVGATGARDEKSAAPFSYIQEVCEDCKSNPLTRDQPRCRSSRNGTALDASLASRVRFAVGTGSLLNDAVAAIRSLVTTTAPERLLPRAAPTLSHGVGKRRCRRRPGQSPRPAIASLPARPRVLFAHRTGRRLLRTVRPNKFR